MSEHKTLYTRRRGNYDFIYSEAEDEDILAQPCVVEALEKARELSPVHPSDCQSCSEGLEPCGAHKQDFRYWAARAHDGEDSLDEALKVLRAIAYSAVNEDRPGFRFVSYTLIDEALNVLDEPTPSR